MKLIGEMLVETTATLLANDTTYLEVGAYVPYARKIVEEFYGPPCSVMKIGTLDFMQEKREGKKGEACVYCGWPRGEHK